MMRLPMLDNILGQPDSHRGVVQTLVGEQCATLAACASHVREARRGIIFSGMGASLFAALPAASRLQQHGLSVQTVESSELLHYGSPALRGDDVGVLISRSGESVEVLRLAEKMRTVGMTVIAITNVPGSSLEQASNLCLHIGAQPDQLIAVQTYTGTVLALLMLAEQVLAGEIDSIGGACLRSLPVMSTFIDQCMQASERWRGFFEAPGPLYFLGRGPALASVHEGALLLHETAKAAAIGMSSGNFRHGPVEVVSPDFRAIVFGAPPQTASMDRSLAGDLVNMGASVRWIGPEPEPRRVSPLVCWPSIHPDPILAAMLAPLFDIIPLQVAAYQLALWRSVTPGDFRYASAITAEETGFPFFLARVARP